MSVLNKQVAYKTSSHIFEGDSFMMGPFDNVDDARAHFAEGVRNGVLDPGAFEVIFLNPPGSDPMCWEELSRVPGTLQGPNRLFSTT